MGAVLDDFDARPGSTTSLLRTVLGAPVRSVGGRITSSALVALMTELGIPADRTRTAVSRLKAKGVVAAAPHAGVPGYAITADAAAMFARGDRRIFEPRHMADGEAWCLVSFSVPEREREVRHQLRRRLGWIGAGTVAGGLWICPAYLVEEVEQIVDDLGLTGRVTIFVADAVRGVTDLAEAVAQWWDLKAIGALHDAFLASHAEAIAAFRADPQPRTAFRTWITALDAWRPIPYLDPGLAAAVLPKSWPGRRSIPLFLEFRDEVTAPAAEFVRLTVN